MRSLTALLLVFLAWFSAAAAPAPAITGLTAQGALKLLTKEQAKNLVHIEARDGAPAPERWYIDIYDTSTENGLREIVVWQKAIVASRTVSQFLDSAKPEDVVGVKMLKIDSDELIRIAQQFVEANNVEVAKLNFSLSKNDGDTAPVWRVTCLDDSGKKLGELIVNARTSVVMSHEGFELAPGQSKSASTGAPSPTPPQTAPAASPSETPVAAVAASPVPTAMPVAVGSPGPSAAPSPTPKRGFFQKIFGGGKSPTPTPTPKNH